MIILLSACQMTSQDEYMINVRQKRKLTIELITFFEETDPVLHQKIREFARQRPDLEIEIRNSYHRWLENYLPPEFLDKKGSEDPPDLVELTPLQMKLAYHHGKLESLSFNPSQMGNLLIMSHDGSVLGLKTKIIPLIVYYNQNTFMELGLEEPSADWDWAMLDNTILALKTARKNVHIKLAPAILEWFTINRYGGRIADESGTVFTNYLDDDKSIQAAEWLHWIGTIESNYDLGKDNPFYNAMPRELIAGNIALAIDFAHSLTTLQSGINVYEAYIEQNDQIRIAPMPGGPDVVNVAHTSGLMIPKFSQNKDLAMELLRYLTEDVEAYYHDIAWYTLQSRSTAAFRDPLRLSMLLHETKRSIPTSLYFYDGGWTGSNEDQYSWVRRRIFNGYSIETELKELASEIDYFMDLFKEDLANFSKCMRDHHRICIG